MSVNEETIKIFHDSLDRACANGRFLDVFYGNFISSSIDIEKIFKDTDMERLKRKLKSSLHMMTLLIDQAPGMEMYVGHLARVHDRYHIPPEFFNIWLDSLIESARACDKKFDQQTEAVWRSVVGQGISIMQQGAKASVLDADSSVA